MSECGRTARENGNRGTDHGHANVMFVVGGPVTGKMVAPRSDGIGPGDPGDLRELCSANACEVEASNGRGALVGYRKVAWAGQRICSLHNTPYQQF